MRGFLLLPPIIYTISMNLQHNQQFHLGVYGICITDNKVLLIKKGRGPYKGLYDLPGGRIEFGEPVEVALQRELQEEVGGEITDSKFLGYNEYFCKFINDKGEEKDFHHIGLYFTITCDTQNLKTDADGHDSLGARFMDIREITKDNCSQIAFEMIQKVRD
jgi:8-oxo-dGTP diphosphatase